MPQSTVLTSTTGGGQISPAAATSYATGGQATYAATANAGQIFLGWTLDNQFFGYASPLTFTVDANRTPVATFVPRPAFGDVPPGDPEYAAYARLAALGIVNPVGADGEGNTLPGRPVLRAEVAAFVARTFGCTNGQADTITITATCTGGSAVDPGATLVLSETGTTITRAGAASGFVLTGVNARTVLQVNAGVTASISGIRR